jgi:hypothetical protein
MLRARHREVKKVWSSRIERRETREESLLGLVVKRTASRSYLLVCPRVMIKNL